MLWYVFLLEPPCFISFGITVFTYGGNSAVEVNVSIVCACMPACAHFFRRHGDSFRSLSSRVRIRIKSFYNISSRKSSSNADMRRANSDEVENDQMKLTLGSAAKTGRFLETSHWPITASEDEDEREKDL